MLRKKGWIFMAALCFVLCITVSRFEGLPVVQARERRALQTGTWELVSRGNIVYRDGEKEAGIYAADFSFLQEKLSSITGETFDPSYYDQTNKSVSGADAAYCPDERSAEREPEIREWTQFPIEEPLPEIPPEMDDEEHERQPEMDEEEPEIPPETDEEESERRPETVEEARSEMMGEEQAPAPEVKPEISVSGNDCMGTETENETQKTTEENIGEGGEDL